MQHIFLPPEQISDTEARITGAEHLHLARVLRTRVGEAVTVLDGRGNAFRAVLVSIGKSDSVARIEEAVVMPPEPPLHLKVVQALGKGDKFEQVIQHGTEAGASSFVPLRAERCVADVPASREKDKLVRWQQIAKSAAEQSGRALIPCIDEIANVRGLLYKDVSARREQRAADDPSAADSKPGTINSEMPLPLIMLHTEPSALPLKRWLQTTESPRFLAVAIGPEGGWSKAETEAAEQAEIPFVSLGPRILRTETAALVAISQILYHFENI